MGERKVLNKYYPPDFDPAKIPRRRKPKNQQIKVRTMLSMSIRCKTCGNYMYQGTKINAMKEDVISDTYLGIKKFRFYFKCTNCKSEIVMKTDPKNIDYVVEEGASRNFEPWRDQDEQLEKERRKRCSEEMGDAMKSLENRTMDSKRSMDVMANVDELKCLKSRHETVSVDAMLQELSKEKKVYEEEDEALIKSIFHVQRLDDDDDDDDDDVKKRKLCEVESKSTDVLMKKGNVIDDLNNKEASDSKQCALQQQQPPPAVRFVVKRKANQVDGKQLQVQEDNNDTSSCLQSLCQYDIDHE